jgi:hypothetical protein
VSDPNVRRVLIDRWSKLSPDDDRNLLFDQAADLLKLEPAQRKQLKGAGATDLRTIAQALKVAPETRRHNTDVARLTEILLSEEGAPAPPQPITVLPDKMIGGIGETIGAALSQLDPTG